MRPKMMSVSEQWLAKYPDAMVGVLVLRGIENRRRPPFFQEAKEELERRMRERFAGLNRERLKTDPVISAYDAYYRKHRKTYHVLLQLETVTAKEKPISGPSALVEAMFMAELDNRLLTAGYDLDFIDGNLIADVAQGGETYLGLGRRSLTTKAGDLMILDEEGILSSVIYGPDHRTRIRKSTENAVFTVYGPKGIPRQLVENHLVDIENYVSLISREVSRELLQVYPD